MRTTLQLTKRCFLSLAKTPGSEVAQSAIRSSAMRAGYNIVSLPPTTGSGDIYIIAGEIAATDCVIADVSDMRRDVYVEINFARAMSKPILLLCEKTVIVEEALSLQGFPCIFYELTELGLEKLEQEIDETLQEFKRLPLNLGLAANRGIVSPFVINWERLDRSEIDNLCFELLTQMGYKQVEWNTRRPREVDIVAEYPKIDPDGYDYNELWLVGLGRKMPVEDLLQAAKDPVRLDFISLMAMDDLYNMVSSEKAPREKYLPIVYLIIMANNVPSADELEELRSRLERRPQTRSRPTDVRVRVWDRAYLTLLVQQFPQIGYKYFSDEARAQSKYRKTPEELYEENIELSRRQAELIMALEAEKNMRVRAERDAVWKDIAFTTAHKIGNPIFAIETYLAPLEKRIRENRNEEANEVVQKIGASVEKAKGIVEQFKSLTKAQEITFAPVRLLPVLEEACTFARNQDITVTIDCAEDVTVSGDVERLTECFDELVVNSTHWFDKTEKRVTIQVTSPTPLPLPAFLDSTRHYALVNYQDNGSGVAIELKNDIFNAFSTTRDQGTGLGLALVRRIVEGHGGAIYENGITGKGASFYIYLPTAQELRNDAQTTATPRRRKQSTRSKKE